MGTLKDCLYATVHRNHKPLKLIAEEIGMSQNYLTRSALPDPEECETGSGCRFPINKLIPLIRVTGDFAILDHIEDSLGRIAIVKPTAAHTSREICRQAMKSVKEFGELMASLDVGLADGKLTDAERERITDEGYEAMQAIVCLLQTLGTGDER